MKLSWKKYFLFASVIIAGGGLLFVLVETVRVKNTGFEVKTLWDWMELLIVPLVLAGGAFYLNRSEKELERNAAKERAKLELEIATDRQQEAALQTYFDRMSELLLKEKLRTTVIEEVRDVARTRTISIMRVLDTKRNNLILQFLREAKLITDEKSILNGASMEEMNLQYANLRKANLEGANLRGADLTRANLNHAILQGINLQGADLERASLGGANLTNASLECANLTNAILTDAKLPGAKLAGANLTGAKLEYVSLRGAYSQGANLTNANLTDAKFAHANLQGASLQHVKLTDANLRKANLEGANLRGADLTRANLTGANVSNEQLANASALKYATMPDGTKHE